MRRWICSHLHKLAGPWHDENGWYERCLDCGRRISWTDPLPIADPRQQPPAPRASA